MAGASSVSSVFSLLILIFLALLVRNLKYLMPENLAVTY